ncbi:FecCD family ABC transporter permease [Solidesulfovibrio sp.]
MSGVLAVPSSLVRRHLADGRIKRLKALALAVLLTLLGLYALAAGNYDLPLSRVAAALLGQESGPATVVVLGIRLPRILAAIAGGFGLAVSGVLTQSLLGNPLASPFTLGISHGAAFGAACGIVFLGGGSFTTNALAAPTDDVARIGSVFTVSLCAFAGALASAAMVSALALLRRLGPQSIILCGVALSSLFTAGTILIQFFADDMQVAAIVFWTFGDVSRAKWLQIGAMALAGGVTAGFCLLARQDLNALLAGDDVARSVGVRTTRLRLTGMGLAALCTGVVVAVCGVIAFLGLLAPHIARRSVGADHGPLTLHAGLWGALLLLGADTLGKLAAGTGALPVGVLTSFLGAPLFLFLLLRGGRT